MDGLDPSLLGLFLLWSEPGIAEPCGLLPLDFVVIDMEAGALGRPEVLRMTKALAGRAVSVLVRVPSHDQHAIEHALDIGADGVMVPKVSTRAEAEAVAAATRFPPAGRRGVNPVRESGYFSDLPGYFEQANDRVLCVVQIETAHGVENAEAIAAVPGVDGLFLGMGDKPNATAVPGGQPRGSLREPGPHHHYGHPGARGSSAKKKGAVVDRHWHGLQELPGGETDSFGRPVDLLMIGELAAATVQGCAECRDRLLDAACQDAVAVVRLVETACLIALRVSGGDLPSHMLQDDHGGPGTPEFRELATILRAGRDIHGACEAMTDDRRRAVADSALECLAGFLLVANEEDGIGGGQSLPEASVATAALMAYWWAQAVPRHAERLRLRWEQIQERAAGNQDDVAVPGWDDAVSLLLGASLHQQGVRQDITGDTLPSLCYPEVLSVLADPVECDRLIAEFAFPLGATGYAAGLRRVLLVDEHEPDPLVVLVEAARQIVGAHHAYCCDGNGRHSCTLAHIADILAVPDDAADVDVLASRRRTMFLRDIGYRVEPSVEGPPPSTDPGHRWQFALGRIVLRRFDADAERWNEIQADDSSLATPRYEPSTGLEILACSWCGATDDFLAEGVWGDPLTLHCSCGTTTTSPDGPSGLAGRQLFQHLVLTEVDPAYPARRAERLLNACLHDQEEQASRPWYDGPSHAEVRIAEGADPAAGDLAEALFAALAPRLPARHPGYETELLLVQSALVLADPAAAGSADGLRLADAVRTLLTRLRTQSDKFAPRRRPVIDYLSDWQREGGPGTWQAAWQRTIQLVGSRVGKYANRDGNLRDGCAAVTVALYILADEQSTQPDQVGIEQLREFAALRDGEDVGSVPPRWEQRLAALGHDLADANDPVARLWQHLRTELPARGDDVPGPALLAGLDTLFRPTSPFRL
ncbi:aldolase/citrate lyase family protein [Kitasatospora sp. NBC_01246]|uniref:HpcH/HpaI aldolase family protein n=1 Tax=Kitasatospora sp. NBC_01246 TaxID=2903570 RepID=UPI002E358C53|nr:aldolase/citrate lyase family protein [Kitasatospora sp. NBC_01246]